MDRPRRLLRQSEEFDDLLAKMTLQEKVGQLQQLDGDPNTGRVKDEHRDLIKHGLVGSFLNVHGARNVNEVQHMAVNQSRLKIPLLLGFDVIHGYRTIFPIPLGETSSWDPATVEPAGTCGGRGGLGRRTQVDLRPDG